MNRIKLAKALHKAESKADWYRIESKKDVADVYIYDEISWIGVDADSFVKDINSLNVNTIKLHLNTPGGSVFDGIAIYNALKQHKATVETYIEGLAASSGSIVALAGDKVKMSENAFYMIHEPWVLMIGNSAELRQRAELLDKISGSMVKTYMKATGKEENQIKEWLAAETWFTAEEAMEAGFIDEVISETKTEAKHDLEVFDNVPDKVIEEFETHAKEKDTPENTKKLRESMRMRLELEQV